MSEKKYTATFFNPNAGYENQREEVNRVLTLGREYEVAGVILGQSSTKVYLKGVKESPFNSVFFEFNFDYTNPCHESGLVTSPYLTALRYG